MAKVFIEETTLTAIGDAIRGKTGKTDLIDPANMGTEIEGIEIGSDPIIESLEITSNGTYTATDCDGYSPITVNVPQEGGPPEEAFNITGSCGYRFAFDGWTWFIEQHGDKITTSNVNVLTYMFYSSKTLKRIPFVINVYDLTDISNCFNSCFQLMECPKIRGNVRTSAPQNANFGGIESCYCIRDFNDLFDPSMLDFVSNFKCTSQYSVPRAPKLRGSFSLRSIPEWLYKFTLSKDSTAAPYTSYALYSNLFQNCYTLDEVKDLPVWTGTVAVTSNMFSSTFSCCNRLKRITFETNADGTPIAAQWKTQTIDLSEGVGFVERYGNSYKERILGYNSGITEDKLVSTDDGYQALKDDPDFTAFCQKNSDAIKYSRYNHDSAVETLNSLPDTSATGTNTIKFRGLAGSGTDSGAINTLTAEEIAVAAAKGWTVTLV